MDIARDMRSFIADIGKLYPIPPVRRVVFPPLTGDGDLRHCNFMALQLEDNSTGLSYIQCFDDEEMNYRERDSGNLQGKSAVWLAGQFGLGDSLGDMIGLAAINSICQHVMKLVGIVPLETGDSFGGLNLRANDTLGMVGYFRPMMRELKKHGSAVIILEREEVYSNNKHLPMTTDTEKLKCCNKICITSTTILNTTLDEILHFCKAAEYITVIGPTAGFLPDPLFSRGVHAVGGRYVHDGNGLIEHLIHGRPWGSATKKILFRKENYKSPL